MAFLALHTGQVDAKKQKDHSAAEIHRNGFREPVSAHDRAGIEEVFKAPVSTFYSKEESVAIAMQCAMGEGYHIQMEMGIVELVPFRAGMSEIVGTGLHNMVMPFLRYRTGDLTTDGSGPCPCGRKHPLIFRHSGQGSEPHRYT